METTILLEGICWDNGKGNGNYYFIIGEKKIEKQYIFIGDIWGSWKRTWKLL